MIIQWVGIASAIFAGIALILNFTAFAKQQKITKINFLADVVSRFFELEDKRKEYEKRRKIGEFSVLYLNFLEWFAYLVNNEYIPLKMTEMYQGIVVKWYEDVLIKQKESLAGYTIGVPSGFSELNELYEKIKRLKK